MFQDGGWQLLIIIGFIFIIWWIYTADDDKPKYKYYDPIDDPQKEVRNHEPFKHYEPTNRGHQSAATHPPTTAIGFKTRKRLEAYKRLREQRNIGARGEPEQKYVQTIDKRPERDSDDDSGAIITAATLGVLSAIAIGESVGESAEKPAESFSGGGGSFDGGGASDSWGSDGGSNGDV